MSTWTSRLRPGLMLAAAVPLLAACLAAGGALQSRPVLGGALTVAAPPGYCIDPAGVLERQDTAIVLIGRCAVTGETQVPQARAILTVAVGGAGSGAGISGGGAQLAAFFKSPQGRAALSRSGRAASVTLHEALVVGDAFLMRLTDTSPGGDSRGQPESWRAVLDVEGRLVTLSVSGPAGAPMDPAAGRRLTDRFLAAMQAANRAKVSL
ncbi:cation transport ATPase [Paracoccaceae bacterium Fryx2]|nr:cation transport ATPase [Paracoccaceae bacterium Fryx2]